MGGIKKMFTPPKIEAPKVEPPVPMPNEGEVRKTAKRRVAKDAKSGGAASTLLSTGGRETLGS